MTSCSGVCKRFKCSKNRKGSWYSNGIKRCNFCKIYIKVDRLTCPCCKKFLRTRGRGPGSKLSRESERIEL